ncbi:hypothetical protein Mgra_00005563 [Meloidogyne graminicola]|uniref:Uncharacterized protein n=1 Tax=Meloidogyne graminicola TaxID=189291 RepID=A0A8S9ZNG8_9BILA|nr:hypothetical protein Mgra_00005563 [Meloidogyne graminicola]
MNILQIFLLFNLLIKLTLCIVSTQQKTFSNIKRITTTITFQKLNKLKINNKNNIPTKIEENKKYFNFLGNNKLNKFNLNNSLPFRQNIIKNELIKRNSFLPFSTQTGMDYSNKKDLIFAENNLETLNKLINELKEEINNYSTSFSLENNLNNNKNINLISERISSSFFDKLPTPKLTEIDRKNISKNLFKTFSNEWNKIEEMLEQENIEGLFLIKEFN